jgi:hypothetical protein
MMLRRDLVLGGILGGVGASVATDAAAAAEPQASEQVVEKVATAIGALGNQLRDQYAFNEIAQLRDLQKQYLRTNSRLPDFIDVGVDLWFRVYDWHVRWQQPLNLGRDPQGRMTVLLLSTSIVMRTDQGAMFVSAPYDNR